MDLVEKAAQRLAQLQKAGIDVPVPQVPGTPPTPAPESIPTPERLAQALERTPPAEAASPMVVPKVLAAHAPSAPAQVSRPSAPTAPRSKVVQIDLDALAAAGLVTPEAQRSQIADEFRVIKRPI